jgi:hypothetical protein
MTSKSSRPQVPTPPTHHARHVVRETEHLCLIAHAVTSEALAVHRRIWIDEVRDEVGDLFGR